ncbi:unnamed protein product [Acanthoscelides obtectus]|uniref:NEDD8-activating enzyme E1 regulatory subunit n=1 Tax=Acanthoscelides obtectus TaxID=200917 RepID=A0A9P0KA80_ACAOB|nr:unnamed protein product [Acanthoscelides obtectus]CAK1672016.1 NEDD8-activating enzyme E1 regulatory subunit [Acanthoscelides obtectus]
MRPIYSNWKSRLFPKSDMSSPAPKSPEQNDKSKKYDRQLRLWGDHGQKLLGNAKVCLINATALGTEVLKSLVLPGIGSFTIVDGEKITEEDIGSNFFLENDSVGLSRAQVATQCLLELNPDVRGDYIDESAEHTLTNTQDFFKNFTVVIATALSEKVLIPLSKHLWECNVPLVVCRSIGFIGYIQLQVKEHTVIETHPDNQNPDLRLDCPWPALEEFLDSINVEALDTKTRSHTPAVVILHYFLKKYQEKYQSFPKTRQEKDALKNMIRACPVGPDGPPSVLEENFEEAIHLVNTCICKTTVPTHAREILDDKRCVTPTQNTAPFWVMCAALREHVEVRLFCKHSSELYVSRGNHCIADPPPSGGAFRMDQYDPDGPAAYYPVLRALERFAGECDAPPGRRDERIEPDAAEMKTAVARLLTEWNVHLQQGVADERVHEVCRYGGAELHSVSATLGGCAAHEVIKLITHQYKPMNNAFFYDAITCSSTTLCL